MLTKILPSRQALVDRIELQYAYGNNVICLISEVGLGKSYLAESFISEKFADHNKAYIKATRGMQDRHVMGLILEQSFSSPLIDYELSILENFSSLSDNEFSQLLIVVDDAHFVSDELLNDLSNLTTQYPAKIKILLTSTRQLPLTEVINLHIESLNVEESMALMQMYYQSLPYAEEPLFNTFLSASKGNPKMLLTWQSDNSKQTLVKEQRTQQFTIYKYLVLLVLSLMLVATVVYYLYPENADFTDEKQQSVSTVITPENIAKDINNPIRETVLSSDNNDEQQQNPQEQSLQELDQQQQPEPQQEDPQQEQLQYELEQPKPQEQQQEQQEQSLHELDQQKRPEQQQEVPQQEQLGQLQPGLKQSEPQQEKLLQEQQQQLEQNLQQDNAWFLSQKPSDYVLQLMLAGNLTTIEQDIAKHKINTTHIFVINSNNSAMYGLTYGQFSSFSDAQKALKSLPYELQNRGVFAKEIAKIQQQIATSN